MVYVILMRDNGRWYYVGQRKRARAAANFAWRQCARGFVVRIVRYTGKQAG
jgi:hypothetical protein